MSAVCTCYDPIVVKRPGNKESSCDRCGHWWMPEHGSMPAGVPEVNLAVLRHARVEMGDEPKIGRNDACYCGSGKKFKKCHGGAKP